MEISARNSPTKTIAVIIPSLTTLVFILGFIMAQLVMTDRTLIHEQRTVVALMTCNTSFVVSETKTDIGYFRMMTLPFLALRPNITPETIDSNHAFLMTLVEPGVRADLIKVLDGEAAQAKADDMSSTFYTTGINVYLVNGQIDIHGVLKMQTGNSKPSTEIRIYRLRLKYTGGLTCIGRFYEVTNEK